MCYRDVKYAAFTAHRGTSQIVRISNLHKPVSYMLDIL